MCSSQRPVRRDDGAAIGVMAKAPIAGLCKTRLIPAIGSQAAARLQHHLIERTLQCTCDAATGPVVLFTDGDAGGGLWDALARRFHVDVRPQLGVDLGERIANAMRLLMTYASRAILIGTDCLTLGPRDLRDAVHALTQAPMVFAPAEDGGYVLIGATTFNEQVLRDIQWGGPAVMADTRSRLQGDGWQPGLDWIELATHWDIDRPADLRRAVEAQLLDGFFEPRGVSQET